MHKDKIILVRTNSFNLKLFTELYSGLCDAIEQVNEAFTDNLIFVVCDLMLIDIFGGYGIIREIIIKKRDMFLLAGNILWFMLHIPIKLFMAHAGNSTTKEAEKSLVMITKLVAKTNDSDQLRIDLNFQLIQMKCRNKNLQNIFFTINYNLILVVSFKAFKNI